MTTKILFTMLLVLLYAGPASARTRDPKPWHILLLSAGEQPRQFAATIAVCVGD